MNFFQFIFSFLYARNWYSGELELSRPRVSLFLGMILLLLLGVVIVAILQAPVAYEVGV